LAIVGVEEDSDWKNKYQMVSKTYCSAEIDVKICGILKDVV